MTSAPEPLPVPVDHVLAGFVDSARAALGDDLRSVVLFGSAAEGKLRKTSDVNVIVVLRVFDAAKMNALREPLRTAHAAIRLDSDDPFPPRKYFPWPGRARRCGD